MRTSYLDIISKIDKAPQWWDEHGVPRYCRFHPGHCGVYIDRAVFLVISCQECDRRFRVACTFDEYRYMQEAAHTGRWPVLPRDNAIPHYGDPPSHACIGDSMNSVPVKILQIWKREFDQVVLEWVRYQDQEEELNEILRKNL